MQINQLLKNEDTKIIIRIDSKDKFEEDKSKNNSIKRSKRTIKKAQENSFTSDINENGSSEGDYQNIINEPNMNENEDIIMEGSLIYRYYLDQIELEGQWSISTETTKERYSYLLIKKANVIQFPVNKDDIDFFSSDTSIESNKYFSNDNFVVKICSANLFELLLIPNQALFENILIYLSGEYHGFFMYYGKTIEDKFTLTFSLEDNRVRVTGDGSNNLGIFHILGYVNFYTIKEQLIAHNDLNSEVINLGELKVTRLYNAFNSSENNRVIKSFQHRRKKEDGDIDSNY